MKKYRITVNEEQLRLIASAVELQMRLRMGQGWALTDNLIDISEDDYRSIKDLYDPVTTAMLKVIFDPNAVEFRKRRETHAEERDIWVALEGRDNMSLGRWGLPKVEEV